MIGSIMVRPSFPLFQSARFDLRMIFFSVCLASYRSASHNTSMVVVASPRLLFAVARDGVLRCQDASTAIEGPGTRRRSCSFLNHTEPSRDHVAHIGMWHTDYCGLCGDQVAAVYVHSALSQVVALLSRTLGTNHVCLDCAVQRARLCGALVTSSLVFRIIRRGLAGVTQISIAPFYYPVKASTFNFTCKIFGSVSMFVVLSWYFIPPNKWLR